MDPARLAIMRVEIIASWRRLENLRSIDQAAVHLAITQVAIIAYNLDKKWSDFFNATRYGYSQIFSHWIK